MAVCTSGAHISDTDLPAVILVVLLVVLGLCATLISEGVVDGLPTQFLFQRSCTQPHMTPISQEHDFFGADLGILFSSYQKAFLGQ